MRKQINIIAGLALSLCVMVATAGESQAFWKKLRDRNKKQVSHSDLRTSNTFATSGMYTGSIEGFIEVGNKKVFVGGNTSIYVSGEHATDSGHFVNRASLYVGGVVEDGIARANFVVVRPAKSKVTSFGPSAAVAAKSQHLTPSASNPNVGTWDEGYE